MGNIRGNAFWEANLPKEFHRPPEADMAALRIFITDKYVHRRYACRDYSEPPNIENYQDHPWVVKQYQQQLEGDGGGDGGGKPNNNNNNGGLSQPPPQQPAVAVVVQQPIPSFDLLSLDDDIPPPPPVENNSSSVEWDPFADIERGSSQIRPASSTASIAGSFISTSLSSSLSQSQSQSQYVVGTVSAPTMTNAIDPFAEISHTRTSSSSQATTATTSITDIFSLPHVPQQAQPQQAQLQGVDPFSKPAAHQPMRPSSATAMHSNTNTTRTPHTSKGSFSHEDILAMFDVNTTTTRNATGGL